MAKVKPTFRYYFMGLVERGPMYKKYSGYSLDAKTFPWLTYREAQADAKSMGGRAVFVRLPDGSKF